MKISDEELQQCSKWAIEAVRQCSKDLAENQNVGSVTELYVSGMRLWANRAMKLAQELQRAYALLDENKEEAIDGNK